MIILFVRFCCLGFLGKLASGGSLYDVKTSQDALDFEYCHDNLGHMDQFTIIIILK